MCSFLFTLQNSGEIFCARLSSSRLVILTSHTQEIIYVVSSFGELRLAGHECCGSICEACTAFCHMHFVWACHQYISLCLYIMFSWIILANAGYDELHTTQVPWCCLVWVEGYDGQKLGAPTPKAAVFELKGRNIILDVFLNTKIFAEHIAHQN